MVCLTAKRGSEAKNHTTLNAFRADRSGWLTSMTKKMQDIHLILEAFGSALAATGNPPHRIIPEDDGLNYNRRIA